MQLGRRARHVGALRGHTARRRCVVTPEERQDWLTWRRLGLGGSDVAAIRAGRSWSVWLSKVKGIDPDFQGEDIDTGRRLERPIAEWAAKELGAAAFWPGVPKARTDDPFRRGTPDYWIQLDRATGLEIKVSPYPWDEIPQAFRLQCAWYMSVFDVDEWILAAFHRSAPAWRIYHLDRDLDFEQELIDEMSVWWIKHVLDGIPPEIDGTSAASRGLDLLRDLPEDRGGRAGGLDVATYEEFALVSEFIDCDRVVKRLDADRKLLRNRVKGAIGDRPGLRWSGGRVKWGAKRLTYRIDTD